MIRVLWRHAPWWIAGGAAILALFDWQFTVAGRALTIVAMAIGLAGVLTASLTDAMLLAIAVSLFPGDAALLGVALALLYRVEKLGSLGFDASLRSMLLFGFFVSAAGSALFGMLAVEARPLQWFVWIATFGAPLLLLGSAVPSLSYEFASLLPRFLLFVLWLQVPVCAAQLVRHGELEPGDWFAGLWGNANLVGLWGGVTLSVCAVRVLTKTVDAKGRRDWIFGCGHAAAALVLVWGASAKLYSVSVFGAAFIVSLLILATGTTISRIGAVLRVSVAILAIALTGIIAESWVRDNYEGLISNWENSEKQILLKRVVFGVAERYNSILGVGPGMLGSRAASAASADVLYKDAGAALSGFLGPAPRTERWAMVGLWDAEAVYGVTDKSALLTMPFSGWGSMRAELGWPAVILLAFYLILLGRQTTSIAARHAGVRRIAIAAGVACFALLPMLFFDNVLEQPHIIVPLAILMITARGLSLRVEEEETASASDEPAANGPFADRPGLRPSPIRGRL